MRIFVKYLSKFSGFLFLLFLIGIWTFISSGPEWSSQYLFPSPKAVLTALFNSREELLRSAWSSLLKLVPAYFAAAVVGISLGIVSGSVPWVGTMLKPISRFAAPIPPNVYIPYAIAILPTFYLSSTFIIFIAAFWPIYLNTAAGAADIPEKYRRNAAIIGIGRFEYLWRIAFVASLPSIFSGLSVGMGLSFIMLTVAELFGENTGLGHFVQFYADYSDYPNMVAGILWTGIVVLAIMEFFEFVNEDSKNIRDLLVKSHNRYSTIIWLQKRNSKSLIHYIRRVNHLQILMLSIRTRLNMMFILQAVTNSGIPLRSIVLNPIF